MAGAVTPHAQCSPRSGRGDDTPVPSSKTRLWALVSLIVRVLHLKVLISSKKPSQMSPGITDPISPSQMSPGITLPLLYSLFPLEYLSQPTSAIHRRL